MKLIIRNIPGNCPHNWNTVGNLETSIYFNSCAWQESLKLGYSYPSWQDLKQMARVKVIFVMLQWWWKKVFRKVMGISPCYLKVRYLKTTMPYKHITPFTWLLRSTFFHSILVFSCDLLITCVLALTFKNRIWGNYHLILKFQAAIG